MGFPKRVKPLYTRVSRGFCACMLLWAGFAAYIAFYTPCWITFRDDEEVSDGPIRLLHGTADDWTPIEPCQEDGTRLRR